MVELDSKESLVYLIKEDDGGRSFALLSTLLVLGLIFHAYVFFVVKETDIRTKYDVAIYEITFEEMNSTGSDSILVGDGETDTFSITRSDIDPVQEQMIAKITFTISYEETSGEILDPCDEVRVQIPPNGMVADWQNTENILADSNDDCEDMTLVVYIYPEYFGETITMEGGDLNEWHALWSDESYGTGLLNLEVSVDTNEAPTSALPTVNDENEEIQIQWDVLLFEASVERMN